jgi:hypothetical protein
MIISAFFLSQTDRVVVWTMFGLAGALAQAARTRNPKWRLRYTWPEALLVFVIDCALVAGIHVYTRMKGA